MKSKLLKIFSVSALVYFLCAFVSPAGGEGFEIYINNKLVLQKFNQDMKNPGQLKLDVSLAKADMKVKFYHCGMAGKERSLLVKDGQNRVLKQWQFTDPVNNQYALTVPVKEMLAIQKKAVNTTLYLYYSSKEAQKGRLLAVLQGGDKVLAASR